MKIFVVVPAYNEEKRVLKTMKGLISKKLNVVVVDDGSSDDTWRVISKFAQKNPGFLVVRHKVNLGKGAAMKTGVEMAFGKGADAVIFMDGDGQHSAKDLDKFVALLEHHDVVLGRREIIQNTSFRIYGSRALSLIANVLYGVKVEDFLCGYRALTKKAYRKIKWNSTDYGVETEMIARIGKNKVEYTTVGVESIYHDPFKGFSVMDAAKLLYNIVSWKITL